MASVLGETSINEIPSVEEQQVEMVVSEPEIVEVQPVQPVQLVQSKGDKVKEFFMKDNKRMLYVTIAVVAVVIIAIIIVIVVVVKKNGETADAEAEADAAKKAAEDNKGSDFWNGSFWGNKK